MERITLRKDPIWIFSHQEMNIIATEASGDESQLYMILRMHADFKTGRTSHYSAKKLSFSFLARSMSRDSRQGYKEKIFTHVEIRRFLNRLVAIGLVTDVEHDGRILSVRLPLVEKGYKERASGKAPQSEPRMDEGRPGSRQGGNTDIAGVPAIEDKKAIGMPSGPSCTEGGMSSGEKTKRSSKSLVLQGFQPNTDRSLSNKSKTSVNTPPNPPTGGEGRTSPPATENQTPKTRHDPAGLIQKTERPGTDSSGSGFLELVEREGEGLIRYHASEISRKIYRSWERCKFDSRDVCEAIRKVLSTQWMLPTPNSIDAVLRNAAESLKTPKKMPRSSVLMAL